MTDAYKIAMSCVERGWHVPIAIIKQLSTEQLRLLLFAHEQVRALQAIESEEPGNAKGKS